MSIFNPLLNQVDLQNECDGKTDKAPTKKAIMINRMRNYLAKRNSTVIWGNGFTFNSNNEELEKWFNKFSRDRKLIELFFWAEELLSKYGRSVITINKTKDDQLKLIVTDNMYLNAIGKSFYTEEVAVIWQRVYFDNAHFFVKSVFTTKDVKNTVYDQDEKLIVFDKSVKILEANQMVPHWNHNLGFVPVVEIGNYPNLSPYSQYIDWNEVTDWWNAVLFENLYYQAYLDFKKELVLCHTRIGLENPPQQIYQSLEQTLIKDMELDADEREYTLSNIVFDTGVGGKATIIPGTGDFTRYVSAMNEIMDFYCKFANSARFSEGNKAQKSTQEVKTTRSAQVEAINTKVLFREKKYSELIAKILACYDKANYFEEWDFVFKINVNIQKEETLFLDNIIKQVNMGTMSMVEAISKLRNISLSEAEKIFESIKTFNEENDILTNTSAMNMEDDSGPYDNAGGEGAPTQEGEIQ